MTCQEKKPCTEVQDIEFMSNSLSSLFCHSSSNSVFIPLYFVSCFLIAFPSHLFAYFLISSYLLQTLDNSNYPKVELFSISLEDRLELSRVDCSLIIYTNVNVLIFAQKNAEIFKINFFFQSITIL